MARRQPDPERPGPLRGKRVRPSGDQPSRMSASQPATPAVWSAIEHIVFAGNRHGQRMNRDHRRAFEAISCRLHRRWNRLRTWGGPSGISPLLFEVSFHRNGFTGRQRRRSCRFVCGIADNGALPRSGRMGKSSRLARCGTDDPSAVG